MSKSALDNEGFLRLDQAGDAIDVVLFIQQLARDCLHVRLCYCLLNTMSFESKAANEDKEVG